MKILKLIQYIVRTVEPETAIKKAIPYIRSLFLFKQIREFNKSLKNQIFKRIKSNSKISGINHSYKKPIYNYGTCLNFLCMSRVK